MNMGNHESYETQLRQAGNALESTIWELDYYDRKGNAALLRRLRSGDLDNPSPEFLDAVIQAGKLTVFRFLIEHKFQLDSLYDGRDTILHQVALSQKSNLLRYLIRERHADLNVKNITGNTPLHSAALVGNKDAIRQLTEAGADVNARDEDGAVVLHHIAYSSATIYDESIVKHLVEHGADVNVKNEEGETPLHLAVQDRNQEIVETLVELGAEVNAKDNIGQTPLHYAVFNEPSKSRPEYYIPFLQYLIDHDAKIDNRNAAGDTPLHKAARGGNALAVEFLLANGADVTIKNDSGKTAPDIASEQKSDEIIELFSIDRPPVPRRIPGKEKWQQVNPVTASFKNRRYLKNPLTRCVCYYCGERFIVSKITDWCDEDDTALCPYCGVDGVLVDQGYSDQDIQMLHRIGWGEQG